MSDIKVHAGTDVWYETGGQDRLVDQIWVHPNYDPNNYDNDRTS